MNEKDEHGKNPEIIETNLDNLKKCQSKFDDLIFETFFFFFFVN